MYQYHWNSDDVGLRSWYRGLWQCSKRHDVASWALRRVAILARWLSRLRFVVMMSSPEWRASITRHDWHIYIYIDDRSHQLNCWWPPSPIGKDRARVEAVGDWGVCCLVERGAGEATMGPAGPLQDLRGLCRFLGDVS